MIDFIGIGTQKAGTTWLWGMLRQHSHIDLAPVKEVHYFDVLYLDWSRAHTLGVYENRLRPVIKELVEAGGAASAEKAARLLKFQDPHVAFTDEWYLSIFSDSSGAVKRGEITPNYSALPPRGIEHVRRLAPNARLIYLVRDPIERATSSLKHMTSPKRTADDVLASKEYFSRGDYRSSIPRWEEQFSREQILFLPFGKIRTDPLELLRSVERHIGVPPLEEYRGINKPRASTEGKELVVTETMMERIVELFSGQYEYLRERFGDDFVSQIA